MSGTGQFASDTEFGEGNVPKDTRTKDPSRKKDRDLGFTWVLKDKEGSPWSSQENEGSNDEVKVYSKKDQEQESSISGRQQREPDQMSKDNQNEAFKKGSNWSTQQTNSNFKNPSNLNDQKKYTRDPTSESKGSSSQLKESFKDGSNWGEHQQTTKWSDMPKESTKEEFAWDDFSQSASPTERKGQQSFNQSDQEKTTEVKGGSGENDFTKQREDLKRLMDDITKDTKTELQKQQQILDSLTTQIKDIESRAKISNQL
jgi:hypothetical protein